MSRRLNLRFVLAVQVAVLLVVAAAVAMTPDRPMAPDRVPPVLRFAVTGTMPRMEISRETPLRMAPLYDDPTVVSDADLAAVLRKTRPAFPRRRLKPNHVEHALRTWGVEATFRDPRILSGREMVAFLTDHSRYLKSWSGATEPLLVPERDGVAVRWGREPGASVHHDHLLACLTEAGVRRDAAVYPPGNNARTIDDLLQQSVRDFRLDEREMEWSAMVFALWLPPDVTQWRLSNGRTVDFDLIARRLMRGDARHGVCGGTHRVYSLVLLLRIDKRFGILSKPVQDRVRWHLRRMRDLLVASQFPDGHWASNWSAGRDSVENPISEPGYKSVIATGHHLEWLAMAAEEFHPPRDVVRKAARWLIQDVRSKSEAEILSHYTFYSHVGNALALWRKTRPAPFWKECTASSKPPR